MAERIRAWANGGGFWRHLLLHMMCQTPTLVVLYASRDTLFGL